MNLNRRQAIERTTGCGAFGLLVAAGLITPDDARAQVAGWNKAAFEANGLQPTVKSLGGDAPGLSDKVTLTGPDIAENGAVVPVGVSTTLPNVTQMALLVDKNPNTLAAVFDVVPGMEPFVTTRVKMGQSSMVYAVVKSDGKWYYAQKDIKVTLGGCGG